MLASTLKLFFRELPEPLIDQTLHDMLAKVVFKSPSEEIKSIKAIMTGQGDAIEIRALQYLLQHLKRVSEEPANKMDARNLATVFSPNLVHSATKARRPESMITEMEYNNVIVEKLITYVYDIFPN